MKDVMLDIETLGTSADAVITQIGACYFDRLTGEIGKTFLVNISISSSLAHKFKLDVPTLEWWLSQPPASFLENTESIVFALTMFNDFVKHAETIWCHATFDFPLVMEAMKKIEVKSSFHYTIARDIRTLSDLAQMDRVKTKNQKTHNALEDCLHQVEYCTPFFNKLNK